MYRLMLADDQQIIMEGIAKLIRQADLPFDQFVFVQNGQEALDRLTEEAPDALITDIRMPVMDGLELCRRIRERKDEFRDMPILVLTGYDEFEYAREAIAQKVLFYLLKPVRREELYSSCRMMVDVLEERKVRMSEKASRINLREHVIRNALNPSEKVVLQEAHPEGLLLLHILSAGEIRGFYPRIEKLRKVLTENLYAVYVRDAEVYFLLNTSLLPEEIRQEEAPLEMNLSRPFYDLADLQEAIRQIHLVHLRRESLPGQKLVSYSDIQNSNNPVQLVSFQDLRQLWNVIGQEDERRVRSVMEQIHRQICEKAQNTRSGTAALYAAVCMEIYKRYYSIPLSKELKEEFDFLLHSGALLIREQETGAMGEAVSGCVVRISRKIGEKQKESVIERARELIHESPELSLNELAERLHISSQYLSTLFHRETGMAFGEYQIQERMRKACQLLVSTRQTAEQIARSVGYTSEKHFFVVFKKIMGVSPSRYRKQNTNTEG